jgi:hypothetical protein
MIVYLDRYKNYLIFWNVNVYAYFIILKILLNKIFH